MIDVSHLIVLWTIRREEREVPKAANVLVYSTKAGARQVRALRIDAYNRDRR